MRFRNSFNSASDIRVSSSRLVSSNRGSPPNVVFSSSRNVRPPTSSLSRRKKHIRFAGRAMLEPAFFLELLHGGKHGGVGNRAAFADRVEQLRHGGFAWRHTSSITSLCNDPSPWSGLFMANPLACGYLRRIDVRRFSVGQKRVNSVLALGAAKTVDYRRRPAGAVCHNRRFLSFPNWAIRAIYCDWDPALPPVAGHAAR